MAVGTGGGIPHPQYFAKPNKFKSIKQRHINQCIEIRLKYAHSSVDLGNYRCTNVQNCTKLYPFEIEVCFLKCTPPPPQPQIVTTALS